MLLDQCGGINSIGEFAYLNHGSGAITLIPPWPDMYAAHQLNVEFEITKFEAKLQSFKSSALERFSSDSLACSDKLGYSFFNLCLSFVKTKVGIL